MCAVPKGGAFCLRSFSMKFEYKQVEFNIGLMRKQSKYDELNEMLTQLGKEGWELTHFQTDAQSSTYFFYVFKRPLRSDF